jgi:hypothetical protein
MPDVFGVLYLVGPWPSLVGRLVPSGSLEKLPDSWDECGGRLPDCLGRNCLMPTNYVLDFMGTRLPGFRHPRNLKISSNPNLVFFSLKKSSTFALYLFAFFLLNPLKFTYVLCTIPKADVTKFMLYEIL